MDGLHKFLDSVKRIKNKLWIRHVVVPGITDGDGHIRRLAKFVNTIPNVQKIELLAYHIYCVNKYKEMCIPYRFENVPPLSADRLNQLYEVLNVVVESQ